MKLLPLTILIPLLIGGCASKNAHDMAPSSEHSMTADAGDRSSSHNMVAQMKSMNASMADDLRMSGHVPDEMFLNLMIEHHRGAVMMCEAALETSKNPDIESFCGDVMRVQRREIDQLLKWRKEWYGY